MTITREGRNLGRVFRPIHDNGVAAITEQKDDVSVKALGLHCYPNNRCALERRGGKRE